MRKIFGIINNDLALNFLGTSIEEYYDYLESKFTPEMNWDNYGTYWNIDHIKPLNYFNPCLAETIRRFHYTNTQPLTVSENRQKGNKEIKN